METTARHTGAEAAEHSGGSYPRFFAMIGTSTALMLGLMYLNTYAVEHVYWSETRFYMAFVMGATMAAVMLAFMLHMYRNKTVNAAIFVGAAVVFAGALWLVRSQETVQDESWMSAMIPHHSIAIMTSRRAELSDPRVKKLAEEIVHAQDREIAEMRFLLEDIARNGEAGPDWPLGEAEGPAEVEPLLDAVATPVIAGIRPAPMSADDIERGLGGAPVCRYVRAVDADPILATDGNGRAIAKISGSLVAFESSGADGEFLTDGGRMALTPLEDEDAALLFELATEPPLAVGFIGHWRCT